MKFRKIDPGDIDRRHIYRLMVGTIVPRPIAWVSTISAAGHVNLAPFSFFTAVSHAPPMVSISVGMRDEIQKHTARNILETMGYVIHVVANGLEEQMNVCAGNYPPDVNEFEEAGLDAVDGILDQMGEKVLDADDYTDKVKAIAKKLIQDLSKAGKTLK